MDTPGERLKWARLNRTNFLTPTDAARAYGWTQSTYLGHENGDRIPSRRAAMKYAAAYRVDWHWILEGGPEPEDHVTLTTVGELAAGIWRDADANFPSNLEQFPIVPDQRYERSSQYLYVARDYSADVIAEAGDALHCVDVEDGMITPKEGEIVIVERVRALNGSTEISARVLLRQGGKRLLQPLCSEKGRLRPIDLDAAHPGETVKISALVIGIYKPLKGSRRLQY